jgi:hypothetical protein
MREKDKKWRGYYYYCYYYFWDKLVLFYYELIILGPYFRGLKFLWEKQFGPYLKKKN